MTTTMKPEQLLTVSEVAKKLRVGDCAVRRWINQGTLEAVILPNNGHRRGYRIKTSVLDTLIGEK